MRWDVQVTLVPIYAILTLNFAVLLTFSFNKNAILSSVTSVFFVSC